MKLRELRIKNFRSLADVTIPLDNTTVLVGENNAGKTSVLDALRLALTLTSRRAAFFDEYDYRLTNAGDSPESVDGIVIELWFREDSPDEWPDSLKNALDEIIQLDPLSIINSIGLRLSSRPDGLSHTPPAVWEFLNLNGVPLGSKGADPRNLQKFLPYFRIFQLSTLRDADSEFSPRSQYWGRILRDLKLSTDQRQAFTQQLSDLNNALLSSDKRLEDVKLALNTAQEIVKLGAGQVTSIQALPIKPWDLMSKSQVVIKGHGSDVDFPLNRHGQGVQGLAVLFLLKAYIDVMLRPSFRPETEALLTLEEPEAHLHPQAARALAASLDKVNSQKIISSHSPYFVQEIPFSQIRMMRRGGTDTRVLYIKRRYTMRLPANSEISAFCAHNGTKFAYDVKSGILTVQGRIEQNEFRALLTIYQTERALHLGIRQLYEETQTFLTDDELRALDTYARRMRGEVLFARAWILVEGQCEYTLLRFFAELLDKPLDQYGISVIDFKNNGSAGAFAALARVFEIPWLMICDNDQAGQDFIREIENRGYSADEVRLHVQPLPGQNMILEGYLAQSGLADLCLEILQEQGKGPTHRIGDPEFAAEVANKLCEDKTGNTARLVAKMRMLNIDASRIPPLFVDVIQRIIAKAQ